MIEKYESNSVLIFHAFIILNSFCILRNKYKLKSWHPTVNLSGLFHFQKNKILYLPPQKHGGCSSVG